MAKTFESVRPLLKFASAGEEGLLAEALLLEESEQREADRIYWAPLKAELEQLRLNLHKI